MQKYNFENEDAFVEFVRENVLTTKEAEAYLNIKQQSFSKAFKNGKFKCLKSVGKGSGVVRLFLKSDLEPYKRALETDLKKYNPGMDEKK